MPLLLLALLVAAIPAAARSLPVTVLVPDDAVAGAVRTALGGRLAATGLALRVTSGTPSPDLVLVPDAALGASCAAHRVRSLDGAGGCGVPGPTAQIVLGWDERRDAGPPRWHDLWELARLPGRRGLPRQAAGTLEIALLADGVAPADIYRTLGSATGLDRAFRKLDQLHPYIVWWRAGAEAARVLQSGAVLITVAPAASLVSAARQHPGIGLQWADSLGQRQSWAIPAAAPHPQAALQVLALLRDPAVAAAIAGPAPPAASAPALVIDDRFWADHPLIETRFALWLAR